MELEQRVKSLEFEMKILKNEVQRTLLDIQEQVLIHYYPSLRAEESAPTQSIESVRDKRRQLEVGKSSDSDADFSFGASNRDLLNVKEALSIMEEANLG